MLASSRAFAHPSIRLQEQQQLNRANRGGLAAMGQRGSKQQRSAAAANAAPVADGNVAIADDLAAYIAASPLLPACGLTAAGVAADLPAWRAAGERLATQLGLEGTALEPAQRQRVYQYYLPVYFWVQGQLAAHRARHGAGSDNTAADVPPLVLGISAPQGCGKSTLVEQLEALFNAQGTAAAAVSIDDFYLTRADQAALAAAHPDNRLLQVRGNAGTHDLELGARALASLAGLTRAGQEAAAPRYDKSAHAGKGDRAPEAAWPAVRGPLQVLFFEGWMLGFKPVGAAAAAAVEPALAQVDAALGAYSAAWDAAVDAWLVVRVADPSWVFAWRAQAEQKMRAAGKPGMSDDEVADFVSRYMPAYKAYLPGLYGAGPTTARDGRLLVIEVDAQRAPVAQQPAPIAGLPPPTTTQ